MASSLRVTRSTTDDAALPSTPPSRRRDIDVINQRLSRSLSPNKDKRKSLPPNLMNYKLSSHHHSSSSINNDDLKSMFSSSSSFTSEELRRISKNPITKRLHVVTSNNYSLPIPFTLKLPPKLSNPNSPISSLESTPRTSSQNSPEKANKSPNSKRGKLVYTPQGYTKVDSSSSSEEEDDIFDKSDSKNTVSKSSPPTVSTNNSKYSKLAYVKNQIQSDELSIIEEVSANGSRQSSIGSQQVLNKPSVVENHSAPHMNRVFEKNLPPVPSSSPTSQAIKSEKIQGETSANKSVIKPTRKVPPSTIPSNINRSLDRRSTTGLQSHKKLSKSTKDHNLQLLPFSNAPNTNFNHVLKIHKRSFSDESHVSSVSEFSSVGDFMNIARLRAISPINNNPICPTIKEHPEIRSTLKPSTTKRDVSINSTSSFDTIESKSSWNSVQESIDITNDFEVKKAPQTNDKDIKGSSDDSEATKPLKISRQSTTYLDETSDDYATRNIGLGKQFSFPNNATNITNNETIKASVLNERKQTPRSSYSSYSGQIEIPNLSDVKSVDNCSSKTPSSYNGTTFSDVRSESSSISELSNSNGRYHQKKLAALTNDFSKLAALPNIPINTESKSIPNRHSRHKSMYIINFDTKELKPTHQRTKSADALRTLKSHRGEDNGERLNIKVAEPPKLINYAVDFKESNKLCDHDFGISKGVPEELIKKNHTGHEINSDSESVSIDLTKEDYAVCTISRKDSTISYKSITEKIKGKEVEVVLLEDDQNEEVEEDEEKDDELLSIYSNYRRHNAWIGRSNSTTSNNTRRSFDTVPSNLKYSKGKAFAPNNDINKMSSLTTAGRVVHELNLRRSNCSEKSPHNNPVRVQAHDTKKQIRRQTMPPIESHYFDYASNENYNFNTFMQEIHGNQT